MTPQEKFDAAYVCALEICSRVGIARGALTLAQQRGAFPRPCIVVGKAISLWERGQIEPHISAYITRRVDQSVAKRGNQSVAKRAA